MISPLQCSVRSEVYAPAVLIGLVRPVAIAG